MSNIIVINDLPLSPSDLKNAFRRCKRHNDGKDDDNHVSNIKVNISCFKACVFILSHSYLFYFI